MCACDWNYTCPQCKGTPFDPRYLDDEPQMPEPEFDDLLLDRNRITAPLMFDDAA